MLRIEKVKLLFSQKLFLLGLILKQFYLLPSGNFQIGDGVLVLSFVCLFFIEQRMHIYIYNDEKIFLLYIISIILINVLYFIRTGNNSFLKSTEYYIFNFMIVLLFVTFIQDNKTNLWFLTWLQNTIKLNLIIQLILFFTNIGRWYGNSRYMGTFNDPNQYGVFILFSTFMIYLIAQILAQKSMPWIILGFLLIVPSASTGMTVGVLLFSSIYFFSRFLIERNKVKFFIFIIILLLLIAVVYMISQGYIKIPNYITENNLYKRVFEKLDLFSTGDKTVGSDRLWDVVFNNPLTILYGSGEGFMQRFGYYGEIHSSILGPLFYYGLVPFSIFMYWCFLKIKNTKINILCVYIGLIGEAIFLINTRQPMYWMLLAVAGHPLLKSNNKIHKLKNNLN